MRKKRRQSNVKSVSKFLLDRSNASTNADNNSSTDDFEAELAKITKGKQKVNKENIYKRSYGLISFELASIIYILRLVFQKTFSIFDAIVTLIKNLVKTHVQENKNAPSGLISSNHYKMFSLPSR